SSTRCGPIRSPARRWWPSSRASKPDRACVGRRGSGPGMADNRYIAVEGVIGVGKTSLARLLAERLQARLVLEEVEDNPFLKDFYRDRAQYAFQTQMHFLFSRYQQQRSLLQTELFSER